MVPNGAALTPWDSLDPDGPPHVVWCRPLVERHIVVLLGAFDPPTRAHVAILEAASRFEESPAALCLTKVLLDRPSDELVAPRDRVTMLDDLAASRGFGFAVANRGTYLDVGRALSAQGIDATLVIGSDKLDQLSDPSFYEDGDHGVVSTFRELRFLVVPRAGARIDRDDLRVLDPTEVFVGADEMAISSTQVRRRVRAGADVTGLVPPEVVSRLGGYTAAR